MKEYDYENILRFLKDFYCLTNIKICLYDKRENELCYYPVKLSSFCSLLRDNPNTDQKCRNCDRYAFSQCKKTHKQYSYNCHAGLYECVSPILYNENIIGYIVIGQIKPANQNDSAFLEAFRTYPNFEELKKAYLQLPTIEAEKIHSAIHILDACAGYEYIKNTVAKADNKIDILMENYINEHLNSDLSVVFLCSHFHLSHSEIYAVFKEYFNSTPAEYVKNRRLYQAYNLIKTTSSPIAEIAKSVGIYDYNYFSKIFKKAFHSSPTDIRKGLCPLS